MSLYGPPFHVTAVDLCIIFQCNLYISCIMSCGNKIVSNFIRRYLARYQMMIIIIIYHEFLPTPRRGSHVKSDKTHTQS